MKTADIKKLKEYGFNKKNDCLCYSTHICGGEFLLDVYVKNSEITTKLTDTETNEEYTLHLIDGIDGAFVGNVRAEYSKIIEDIEKKCFKNSVFSSKTAQDIIEYAKNKYGDELEFLWKNSPDCAILRQKDSQKWYAILMKITKDKLNLDCNDEAEVMNIRVEINITSDIRDYKKYFPAYHMNKNSWITILLDECSFDAELKGLLDKSYLLAKNKKH